MRKEKLIKRIDLKMSAFVLKIIAMLTMTCDHLSYLIFGKFSFLNYIGRIAFPIFSYQITEGYIYTSNLKKYFFRLLVFAIISQIPFMLFISSYSNGLQLNVFFTLLIGLLSITIFDKLSNLKTDKIILHRLYKLTGIFICAILSIIAQLTKCDYGYFGVLIIFSFYLFRNHKLIMNTSYVLLVIIYYGKNLLLGTMFKTYLIIVLFTIFPLLFINLYNHKKGRDTKYFLYIFYPLHLLIIYLLNFII